MWFTGGGTKAGHTIGATDEIGAEAVECVHHIRDAHATWLNLLGLDDNKLTYYHAGRTATQPVRWRSNSGIDA